MYRNLIDNAIRYTPTCGLVTVSLDNLQPSKLTVTVSDTGSGIPLKRMALVFERFYRGAEYSGQRFRIINCTAGGSITSCRDSTG